MIFHYLYRIFCFEYKVCTIPYFLDEMQTYELNDAIHCLQYSDRNLFESSRIGAYVTAQANSKKKLTPTDILKFPWETEETNGDIEISNEDIERLKAKAKSIKHGK